MTIPAIIIFIAVLYLFLIKGRLGHKNLPVFRNWYFAHRGLYGNGIPENSLAAFINAQNARYGIELDIHLLKDGNLAVIHDASLQRTCGADVQIEDLTASELADFRLEDTQEKIPLLSEVLDLVKGEVPLMLELKSVGNNYSVLCENTCRLLEGYNGFYCMESFDPRCVAWLRKNKSEILRGQLAYNLFNVDVKIPSIMKFCLRHHILNVSTRPDFIAYGFADRKILGNYLCRKFWGMQGVTWTIRTQEAFDTACREGWIPVFENIKP